MGLLVIYHYGTEDNDCLGDICAVSIIGPDDKVMRRYEDSGCAARANGYIDALYDCGFARDQPEYQARNDVEL